MEVRVRHQDASNSVHFCDCKFNEIEKVIKFMNQSGGIYCKEDDETLDELSYQIVLEDAGAHVEVLASCRE